MKELIFNFHGIGEPPVHTDPDELNYWLDEASFAAALDGIEHLGARLNVPVKITFDDGNISDVLIAMPALVKRGLNAAFFVCTGRIGQPDYLDVAGIKDLLQSGMEVGSHGVWHVDWRKTSAKDLHAEVIGSKQQLEDIFAQPVTQAGIPFGSYDRRVLRSAKAAGYRHILSSDGGYAMQGSWLQPRLTLDRFWQEKNMIEQAVVVPSGLAGLKRTLVKKYKRLR